MEEVVQLYILNLRRNLELGKKLEDSILNTMYNGVMYSYGARYIDEETYIEFIILFNKMVNL